MTRSRCAEPCPSDVIDAIVEGRCADPFAVLGLHESDGTFVVRAFVPGAESVDAVTRVGDLLAHLVRLHPGGYFEGAVERRTSYRLRAANPDGRWTVDDPYAYGPVLGPIDDWLIGEGSHVKLYDRLGAHAIEHEGAAGVHFALWAPNAKRVSVVGDFNAWDGRRHVMRKRIDTGVWEIFIPTLEQGTLYKYEIIGADGTLLPLKADPVGLGAELRPSTASIVHDTAGFVWTDGEWMAARARPDPRRIPMSIYEVHLGARRLSARPAAAGSVARDPEQRRGIVRRFRLGECGWRRRETRGAARLCLFRRGHDSTPRSAVARPRGQPMIPQSEAFRRITSPATPWKR